MNLKNIGILVFFFCCFGSTQGQTLKAYLNASDKAIENRDFYSSLIYMRNALEFEETNVEFLYQAAESARMMNSLTVAEQYYKSVSEIDSSDTYNDVLFRLAEIQQKLGKYDTAQVNYRLYLSEHEGEDPDLTARAQMEIQACDLAMVKIENAWEEYEIDRLSDTINTEHSEFGAIDFSDTMYYSSLRFDYPEDDYDPTRPVSGILKSLDEGPGTRLDTIFGFPGLHTAHTAFNQDRSRVYFTVCEYLGGDDIRCDLYYKDISETGWGEAIMLDTTVNDTGHTSTQPNVGIDPVTGREVLYFVSDREGGHGELDIYKMEIREDGFGNPVNLDSINTNRDDITPFYHHNSEVLYFSSNGRLGMGGFDIYKAYSIPSGFGNINHLGYPLNTSYDDVYYVLYEDGKTGHMSSNRTGSLFLDSLVEACCFDIYKVKINPFANLIAQTFSAATLDSLHGTTVSLVDLSDPNAEPDTRFFEPYATSTYPLQRDKEYALIVSKPGYFPDTVHFNTVNIKGIDDIVKKVYLQPKEVRLDVFTFDEATREPLRGVTVSVMNIDDPASTNALTNAANNAFSFPITRGNTYRVIASRKGYIPETVIVNTDDFGDLAVIVQNMYLKPCTDPACYLPLVLYFDNDRPDPNSVSKRTRKKYSDTYPPYYARKDIYMRIFAAALEAQDSLSATQTLDNFFETEVKKGDEDLDKFLTIVQAYLAMGNEIYIGLKGYTSPLASDQYNMILGYRRVNSVYNEFLRFNEGSLKTYLEGGQLQIALESFGETNSPSGISDDINDLRNSIYSYDASKERRVEIISVSVIEDTEQD